MRNLVQTCWRFEPGFSCGPLETLTAHPWIKPSSIHWLGKTRTTLECTANTFLPKIVSVISACSLHMDIFYFPIFIFMASLNVKNRVKHHDWHLSCWAEGRMGGNSITQTCLSTQLILNDAAVVRKQLSIPGLKEVTTHCSSLHLSVVQSLNQRWKKKVTIIVWMHLQAKHMDHTRHRWCHRCATIWPWDVWAFPPDAHPRVSTALHRWTLVRESRSNNILHKHVFIELLTSITECLCVAHTGCLPLMWTLRAIGSLPIPPRLSRKLFKAVCILTHLPPLCFSVSHSVDAGFPFRCLVIFCLSLSPSFCLVVILALAICFSVCRTQRRREAGRGTSAKKSRRGIVRMMHSTIIDIFRPSGVKFESCFHREIPDGHLFYDTNSIFSLFTP